MDFNRSNFVDKMTRERLSEKLISETKIVETQKLDLIDSACERPIRKVKRRASEMLACAKRARQARQSAVGRVSVRVCRADPLVRVRRRSRVRVFAAAPGRDKRVPRA